MKNKQKTLVVILIIAVFLMSFMGNSVVSDGIGSYTWYFDEYDQNESWANNPDYMVDGSTTNFSSTSTAGDVQLLTGSTYESTHEKWDNYNGGDQSPWLLHWSTATGISITTGIWWYS